MDEITYLSIAIGVSVGIGFVAAKVKAGHEFRRYQQAAVRAHMTSTTQFMHAAMQTLTEDFKIPEKDAMEKLFHRAAQHGMKMVQVDPTNGTLTPVDGEKK